MNYALIFAGGVGQRMNTVSLPKQFLKVHGKQVIVRTVEHFQNCPYIDGIVVVCVQEYIPLMKEIIDANALTKVIGIVPGGDCAQASVFNGLTELIKVSKNDKDIILIHDGVRPILDEETIIKNIECVKQYGAAITVAKANETILVLDDNDEVKDVVDRSTCYLGRAPQSFYLHDIYNAHRKANAENRHDFIDSAMLMKHYGYQLHTVLGPTNNIKVTTPMDFYLYQAMLNTKENEQIKSL